MVPTPAAIERGSRRHVGGPRADCFSLGTAADLVAAGRKLVGSAQVRRRGFLLQHGSIKLAPAPIAMRDLLKGNPALPPPATLGALTGRRPEELAGDLMRHIAAELGVRWKPATFSPAELELAGVIEARRSSEPHRSGRPAELLRATD